MIVGLIPIVGVVKMRLTVRRISGAHDLSPPGPGPAPRLPEKRPRSHDRQRARFAPFGAVIPLLAAIPAANRCQGPASPQTGRLVSDCEAIASLDRGKTPEYSPPRGITAYLAAERTGGRWPRRCMLFALDLCCGAILFSMAPLIFLPISCMRDRACQQSSGV